MQFWQLRQQHSPQLQLQLQLIERPLQQLLPHLLLLQPLKLLKLLLPRSQNWPLLQQWPQRSLQLLQP